VRRRRSARAHPAASPPAGAPPEAHRRPRAGAGGPSASRGAAVLLEWAKDRDGRKVHAGRLDPRDRHDRAPFTCLGCGEQLVPHLGKIRARHFAHHPGSACPLTAPETALHLDAKERLLELCADAFSGRRVVTLLSRCPACRRLAPRDLAAEGDAAVPEGAVGPLRADVLVLRDGRPALALEVKVTHAVDPEKEAALAKAGVPAIEVDAREEWERGEGAGVAIAGVRSLGFTPCTACVVAARAETDRTRGGEAAEIAELEAYRARGLFGPPPPRSAVPASAPRAEAPLEPAERASLAARFRCPECGGAELTFGDRIARHACPDRSDRPVAWRGYDGPLVELAWWRR
jgi:hypothetical protein